MDECSGGHISLSVARAKSGNTVSASKRDRHSNPLTPARMSTSSELPVNKYSIFGGRAAGSGVPSVSPSTVVHSARAAQDANRVQRYPIACPSSNASLPSLKGYNLHLFAGGPTPRQKTLAHAHDSQRGKNTAQHYQLLFFLLGSPSSANDATARTGDIVQRVRSPPPLSHGERD